jgi:hypothetical protein
MLVSFIRLFDGVDCTQSQLTTTGSHIGISLSDPRISD